MSLRLRLTKRNSRGQSLVETALILPIIVLLLLLGIDLGRVFFTSIDLRNAAHEATMLGGTVPDATCAQMKDTVDRQMGRVGQPNAAVCGPLGTTTDVVYITNIGCTLSHILIFTIAQTNDILVSYFLNCVFSI